MASHAREAKAELPEHVSNPFYRKGETASEFFIPLFVGLFFWLGLIGGLFAVFGPFPQIHQL